MSYFPENFETESVSRYTKLQKGKTKLRFLSKPVFGWETWVEEDGKKAPKRFELDSNIPVGEVGEDGVRQFMAVKVYNYNEGAVQVAQFSQKTIIKAIEDYEANSDYGDPIGYDLEISKSGEGMNTKYGVIASPPKPLKDEVTEADEKSVVDLEQLFLGADPFVS